MAKASLTIAIGGEYQGRDAIKKAEAELRSLRTAAREAGGGAADIMRLGDSMVDLGSNLEVAGKKASDFGMGLTKATAPIAAIGAASMKLASDYEKSVAKVYTIMDKQSMTTEQMSQNILDLSTSTGKSATELTEASYQALSASVETSKVGGFVEQSVKLAKAGFTETATAVDTLTTVINAYGLSADDAAMISDRLVQTQNKGKTTVAELASSMGSVIPTASAYNVSLDNLCAGYVALTKQGIDTANATTALNGMMTELADSGSDVAKKLKQGTGKTFGQLMQDGKSLGDVIQILSDSVGGSSEAFANLWGNVRASKGALAIANAGAQEFQQTMHDMADSAGLVDAALDDLATPAGKAQKAINALKNTGIELGEEMLGAAVPGIEGLAQKAQGLYKWFSELDQGTKQTIVTVGALAVATGPVVTLLGKGTTALGGFVSSLGGGVQNVGTFAAAMRTAETEMRAAGATSVSLGAKMMAAADATGLASKAATMLKGSLAMVGITAVTVAVGLAVDAYAKWKEHTDLVKKATEGLGSAMDAAKASVGDYKTSLEEATGALDNHKISADEVVKGAAEMADTLTDAYGEVGSNATLVEKYVTTIEELSAKGKLTADEQTKLAEAVRGFSQITGESVKVVDEETGALDASLEAIKATAEAYRDKATAAVSQEQILEIDKKVQQAEEALAQAKEEQAKAEASAQKMMADYPEMAQSYGYASAQAEQKVNELTATLESYKKTQQEMHDSITKVGAASLETAEASEDLGTSMDDVAESTTKADEALKAYQKQLDAQYKAQQKAYDNAYKGQQKALQAEERALQKSNQNRLSALQKSLDAEYRAQEKKLDARYDNLKKKLDAEEKALADSNSRRLDNLKKSQEAEVKAFDKATSERIALMDREYEASVRNLEASRDARVKAVDAQIAALNAEDAAAEKAAQDAEREQKKAELQKAVNSAKSTTARQRAEKELSDYLSQIAAEDAKERRQQTIEQLNERKQAINDELAVQKDALKQQYEASKEIYEQRRAEQKEAMEADNTAEYEALQAKLSARETAMAESHERQLTALKESNDAQLTSLKEGQQARLDAMREAQQLEEEAMRESHQAKLEAMRESQQEQLAALKESQQREQELYNAHGATIKGKVEEACGKIREVFQKASNDATDSGKQLGDNYGGGIGSVQDFIERSATTVGRLAKTALESASDGTSGTGENFASGFGNGMGAVDIWSVAYRMGETALSALQSSLGIASPSKEAMWIGEMYGKGVAIGMGGTEADIAAESRRLTDAMTLQPTPYGTYALPGSYQTQYGSQGRQALRQFIINMTINVNARSEEEAVSIGQGFGESLYREFARRERQLTNV